MREGRGVTFIGGRI
jgi:hypothetical protein